MLSTGFVSTLKPTDMELSRLAQRIDKDHGYRLQVGLIPDEITRGRLHADYGRSFAMEVFYSLRQWLNCFARNQPTFESLSEILQDCDVNPHVLCQACTTLFRTKIQAYILFVFKSTFSSQNCDIQKCPFSRTMID